MQYLTNTNVTYCGVLLQNLLKYVSWRVSYKRQELLTLLEHLCSYPDFLVESVLLVVLVFRVVLFICFVCLCPVSCVPNMLPMSLDCQLLIAPSVFSKLH